MIRSVRRCFPALTEDSGGQEEYSNPFQFKGGIQDRTTDWVKFGHRWYSTATGRFTQRDTLDAPLDPANANRYTLAANDPINNNDPLGLYSVGQAAADCVTSAALDGAIAASFGALTSGTGAAIVLGASCVKGAALG